MQIARQAFYEPERILRAVEDRVTRACRAGERIDVLTFVPDGEPTLDRNLGRTIRMLRPLDIPIAVISNASLIWDEQVQEALAQADWVSLKVDAAVASAWHRVDRAHRGLDFTAILQGALAFSRIFEGELVTETMLVRDVNDGTGEMRGVAGLLHLLNPATAYLAIPTRPPAEPWVRAPEETVLNRAYQIVGEQVASVELLIGYEGNAFACTGDVPQDLLSITAVHPMREEAVRAFLARAAADWSVVAGLLDGGLLVETAYRGKRFYLRGLNHGADLPRAQAAPAASMAAMGRPA
jgi:wyosine [tRNA(Phe)-imidazoG37] synthetase (radical SAM superfamily)